MRQVLAAPKVLNNDQNRSLSDLCSNIHSAVVGHVKTALTNLKVCLQVSVGILQICERAMRGSVRRSVY